MTASSSCLMLIPHRCELIEEPTFFAHDVSRAAIESNYFSNRFEWHNPKNDTCSEYLLSADARSNESESALPFLPKWSKIIENAL